jgi:hypothetical protein
MFATQKKRNSNLNGLSTVFIIVNLIVNLIMMQFRSQNESFCYFIFIFYVHNKNSESDAFYFAESKKQQQ